MSKLYSLVTPASDHVQNFPVFPPLCFQYDYHHHYHHHHHNQFLGHPSKKWAQDSLQQCIG